MATKTAVPPAREGNFNEWFNHYADTLVAHSNEYFLTADEVTELERLKKQWDTDYAAATAAADQARAASETKKQTRSEAETLSRSTAKRIQADDRISDALRKQAGLPVHKTTRTPVPPPTTEPTGDVLSSDRLEHTLSYHDSQSPTRRARPDGVIGCEIYLHIGDTAPFDLKEYQLLKVSTRTPDRITFEPEDGGKIANYLLRWINTKGETGPWSQVINATIPAV